MEKVEKVTNKLQEKKDKQVEKTDKESDSEVEYKQEFENKIIINNNNFSNEEDYIESSLNEVIPSKIKLNNQQKQKNFKLMFDLYQEEKNVNTSSEEPERV